MEHFQRFALYYVPRPGELAEATAAWLGWDIARARPVAQPRLSGLPLPLADLTAAPRKYGFHGTIKAPFRLAPDVTLRALSAACATLAEELRPVVMRGLTLSSLGGFLALTPEGDDTDLMTLGAEVVSGLDHLRAPLTADEIARRQPDRLNPRQRDLLDHWGYPFVMEEFRFHLTLTGDLAPEVREATALVLEDWLLPILPQPFVIDDICLVGEDAAGRFHLMSRHALTG